MAKKLTITNEMKVVISTMLENLKTGMSDVDNLAACKTEKIGEDECSDELLIALLKEAKRQYDSDNAAAVAAEKKAKCLNPGTSMYGNKDKDLQYPFPSLWEKSVVIRESQSTKVGPKASDVVEIPSSVEVKPFDAVLFDTHVKQGMFKGKSVQILHDPR